MNAYEMSIAAANLYDGGWRKEDREDLIAEYGLTDEEAAKLCAALAEIEEKQKGE